MAEAETAAVDVLDVLDVEGLANVDGGADDDGTTFRGVDSHRCRPRTTCPAFS